MKMTLDCEFNRYDGRLIVKKPKNISAEEFIKLYSEIRTVILHEIFFDDENDQIPGQMSIYDFYEEEVVEESNEEVALYYVNDPKTAPSMLHFDVFNDLDTAVEYVENCSNESSIYIGSLSETSELNVDFEHSYTKEKFLSIVKDIRKKRSISL